VGVDITTNRFKGIRCALGFNETEVQKAREDDNVNVLALPADYISLEEAEKLVDTFLTSTPKTQEKYQRRVEAIDQVI
jgi:ribose 5-phosphate isomerase B